MDYDHFVRVDIPKFLKLLGIEKKQGRIALKIDS